MENSISTQILENEADLIARAATDDAAFSELYRHYLPKIYGYIYKRTGNQQVAEDLTSQVFLKAFAKLPSYTHRGHKFGAWLYRIATNQLIDHYRKTGRTTEISIEHAYDVATGDDFKYQVDTEREKQKARELLSKLPEKHQEILHLKFFGELEYEEIALALGIKENNARVQVHRALKKFEEIYEKYGK